MSKDSIPSIKENNYSPKEVGWVFVDFFEKNPENKQLVGKLFDGLSWLAFECQKNETTCNTKGWLQKLKNTI